MDVLFLIDFAETRQLKVDEPNIQNMKLMHRAHKCHEHYTKLTNTQQNSKPMAKILTQAQRTELSGLYRQWRQFDHGLVARGPGTVARQTRRGHCLERGPRGQGGST